MKRIQSYSKKVAQPFLWAFYRWYLSKSRFYRYKNLKVVVLPTVFYPGWLGSTKVMVRYLLQLELNNRRVLELGAGSGLISLVAAGKGAIVTATDINPHAVASINESAKINSQSITLIESDLFNKVPPQDFDYIIINPPYFPKNPTNLREWAFYCGENFDFFKRLFHELLPYLDSGSIVLMVLSETCQIEIIRKHAKHANILMDRVLRSRKLWEWHYIFQLTIFRKV
jgi:release factor glutamine methyltransferase